LEEDQLEGNVWQAKMSDASSTNLSIIKIIKITVLTKARITIGKQRSTRQEK
jgi:hypothetical protein